MPYLLALKRLHASVRVHGVDPRVMGSSHGEAHRAERAACRKEQHPRVIMWLEGMAARFSAPGFKRR
ncbi:hypothetical protein NOVOSPHI9U_490003 [Novosphingobium sp. 9U]|nr:hypothetical protein NOVOSPHI9U_490003 [Novosphingobium sp. 9U]